MSKGTFAAKIHVLTVSDRAYAGEYTDTAGPKAVAILMDAFPAATITQNIVPDGVSMIEDAINAARADGARVIITVGGTGISPTDVTPDVSSMLIDRDLPGVADLIRQAGLEKTAMAAVSRGVAGVIAADVSSGSAYDTILVNLAGSRNAAKVGCTVLIPLLPHMVGQLDGVSDDGEHAPHE